MIVNSKYRATSTSLSEKIPVKLPIKKQLFRLSWSLSANKIYTHYVGN